MDNLVLFPTNLTANKLTIRFCLSKTGLSELVVEIKEDNHRNIDFIRAAVFNLSNGTILCSGIKYLPDILTDKSKRYNYDTDIINQDTEIVSAITLAAIGFIRKRLVELDIQGSAVLELSVSNALGFVKAYISNAAATKGK